MTVATIPHMRVVVAASASVGVSYLAFSAWVVGWSGDIALIGDTIGTWKSFAVAAVAFWLGSSSGGKAKVEEIPPPPTGKPGDPVHTIEEPATLAESGPRGSAA